MKKMTNLFLIALIGLAVLSPFIVMASSDTQSELEKQKQESSSIAKDIGKLKQKDAPAPQKVEKPAPKIVTATRIHFTKQWYPVGLMMCYARPI